MAPSSRATSNRRIWAIAGPAMASNTSTALVGLVDTWAVGHLDNPLDLAGLALGAMAMSLIVWSLGFLRMGTTGMVAQDKGAAMRTRLTRTVARALAVAAGLGAVLLALGPPIAGAVVAAIGKGSEEAAIAIHYLDIRLWALPAILAKMVAVGVLIGLQRAGTALALEVFVNTVNAVLTVLFVTVLGYGVAGAAAASLAAELAAGLVALAAIARFVPMRLLATAVRQRRFWRLAGFTRPFAVNAYLFLRTLLLVAAFGLFVTFGARQGASILAGNHVLLNFITLTSLGLDGMAFAAEALVGEAIGARNASAVVHWVRATHAWALAMAALYALVYGLAGPAIIDLFTDHQEVRAAAYQVLPWLTALPLIAVWSYQYDGIFIGATAAPAMFWTMAAALAAFALGAVLAVPQWGNHGLWLAFTGLFAARGAGQALVWPGVARRALRGE